ncbi:hypothetical protein D3C80_1930590 [compost metagenome]
MTPVPQPAEHILMIHQAWRYRRGEPLMVKMTCCWGSINALSKIVRCQAAQIVLQHRRDIIIRQTAGITKCAPAQLFQRDITPSRQRPAIVLARPPVVKDLLAVFARLHRQATL